MTNYDIFALVVLGCGALVFIALCVLNPGGGGDPIMLRLRAIDCKERWDRHLKSEEKKRVNKLYRMKYRRGIR